MRSKKIIIIDSKNKNIYESEYSDLSDLQKIVDGHIEFAHQIDIKNNTDTVFVNEDGLLCDPKNFFTIKGGHQPFAGNAVIVGTNMKNGKSVDISSTLDEIKSMVNFFSIDEIRQQYGRV